MRVFEILVLCGLLLNLTGFFVPVTKRPRLFVYLPILTIILLIIHLISEKYRWQMAPAYSLTVLLFIVGLIQLTHASGSSTAQDSRRRRILTAAGAVVGLLVVGIAWFLSSVYMPVFELPEPTGSYAVGRTSFHLVDGTRLETLSDDPNDPREIMVYAWYPAQPHPGTRLARYRENQAAIGPALAKIQDHPGFLFSHLSLVETHSYQDAPVAESSSPFPVLFSSAGFGGIGTSYQFMTEDLASHGFVVFSVAHPYESLAVAFPDGRVIAQTEREGELFTQANDHLWQNLAPSLASEDRAEKDELARKSIVNDTYFTERLTIRIADHRFVIDTLEKMNSGEKNGLFEGKLDMSRLGIFGHSMGGSTAGQLGLVDSRVTAGINIDGVQFGDLVNEEMQKPYMLMYSEGFSGYNDFIYKRFGAPTYNVTIEGTNHMDFTDFPFYSRLKAKDDSLSGEAISQLRMATVTRDYLLAFFDKYLNGTDTGLLDGPSADHPEVRFAVLIP